MSANEPVSHLSEAELRAMTADLDGIHHDLTMPALKVSLAEWTEDIHAQGDAGRDGDAAQRPLFDRRRFLTRAAGTAGGVAGVALLAACSSSGSSSSAPAAASASGTGSAAAAGGGEGQALSAALRARAMGATLETSGLATYQPGTKAATAGKLGTVPPAVVTFAE